MHAVQHCTALCHNGAQRSATAVCMVQEHQKRNTVHNMHSTPIWCLRHPVCCAVCSARQPQTAPPNRAGPFNSAAAGTSLRTADISIGGCHDSTPGLIAVQKLSSEPAGKLAPECSHGIPASLHEDRADIQIAQIIVNRYTNVVHWRSMGWKLKRLTPQAIQVGPTSLQSRFVAGAAQAYNYSEGRTRRRRHEQSLTSNRYTA